MGFLILRRKLQQWVVIECPDGQIIKVGLLKQHGRTDSVIGFEIPADYKINREEVYERIKLSLENANAST